MIAEALRVLSYSFIPVFLGIILHEVAHGYVAYRRGDPTAMMMGRITLNPLPHIDFMGTLVFVFSALFSPFVFGWAKPVPINPRNFKNINRDIVFVSIAGPMANLFLAFFFALFLKCIVFLHNSAIVDLSSVAEFLVNMCTVGIWANIVLMWLNLLPVPPLDGSKILMAVLPYNVAVKYAEIERYGMLILMFLIFTGIFSYILMPLVRTTAGLVFALTGL